MSEHATERIANRGLQLGARRAAAPDQHRLRRELAAFD
jgi:hypothetical protein